MNEILIPTIAVGLSGAALGLILGVFAKIFFVPNDETFDNIRAVLPGVNCGACGYVGCDSYATHLADKSELKITLCTPGGNVTAGKIGVILGVDAGSVESKTAVVACAGTCDKTGLIAEYDGPQTCAYCAMNFGGNGECSYSCLGYGDCVSVCAYNAIYISNGIPIVDKSLCTGCGMCSSVCPKHIISNEISRSNVHVACSSHEKGAIVRKICSAGCIGCGLCVKKCDFDAIKMDNNLAFIDPLKCTNCLSCVDVCPTHVIRVSALQ